MHRFPDQNCVPNKGKDTTDATLPNDDYILR